MKVLRSLIVVCVFSSFAVAQENTAAAVSHSQGVALEIEQGIPECDVDGPPFCVAQCPPTKFTYCRVTLLGNVCAPHSFFNQTIKCNDPCGNSYTFGQSLTEEEYNLAMFECAAQL